MKTKKILIISGVFVLAVMLVFGFRYRKKRIMYKGEEIAQEQMASVVQQMLDSEKLHALIQQKVQSTDTVRIKDNAHEDYLHEQFNELYELNDFQPIWLTAEGPIESANDLLNVVSKSDEEGIPSGLYRLEEIRTSIESLYPLDKEEIDLEEMLETDFMLSAAALRYSAHLRFGLIDPTRAVKFWKSYPGKTDANLAEFVHNAIQRNSIENSFANLIPQNPYYSRMKEAIAEMEGKTFPGPLKSGIKLTKGDSGANVVRLRELLSYHSVDAGTGNSFDSSLENAVKTFQMSRGLEEDGVVSKTTLAELNKNGEELLTKLRLNLERSRWLSEEDKYLMVNIPEYKVKIYNQGKKDIEMKVIVGKEYTSTPVFTDTMEYIVFSPTWGVPNSIASKEMLPTIKRDPSYLSRNNYHLYKNGKRVDPSSVNWSSVSQSDFNYHIVQQPGRGNALGHVKFIFPNDMNIYLHDTPTGHLFSRSERMFSHGCIRVEKPAELAEYLLAPTGEWPMDKIKANFNLSSPKTVHLPEELPVQIFYMTAWADENGVIHYRDDIYGHDKTQTKLLEDALVLPEPSVSPIAETM